MESSGGPCPHRHGDGPAVSAKTLRRVMRAVYLVVVKKHQPKLAALGVHLHRLLSSSGRHHQHGGLAAARALTLSCRSMDPAAAVVHPLPRDNHGGGRHRRNKSTRPAGAASFSCRSMDPAADVYQQYQYRPREVQFSCKNTPPHKRRRAQRHALRLQHGAATENHRGRTDHHPPLELEYHGSAAAVTRLFELMDAEEEEATKATADVDLDFDDGDMPDTDTAAAWPALSGGPAPRQVRITDSPFAARDDEEVGKGTVDRRADEFITWFHEQLRTQQQRAAVRERGASYYWIR